MEGSNWEMTLIGFQAHVRGYLTRKEIRAARGDFEDIVREIEGQLSHLEWRGDTIKIPHFTDIDGPVKRVTAGCSATKHTDQLFDNRTCDSRHPPEEKTEERAVETCPSPEKTEPERDDFHGNGDGETDSSRVEEVEEREGDVMESTGDNTTIWSSLGLDKSCTHIHTGPQRYCLSQEVPRTPEALRRHRNTLTMELLWLQQAIGSRKKYLSLKDRLNVS